MNGESIYKKKIWKNLHFNIWTEINKLKFFQINLKTVNGHNSVNNGPGHLYDTAIDWKCNFIQNFVKTRSLKSIKVLETKRHLLVEKQ
jgi:hypothetical protein